MIEEYKVDRTGWDLGPWDSEQDRYEWRDPATRFPCLIVRNSLGGLCGYAGIHTGHPLWGKDYSECLEGCSSPPKTRKQLKLALKHAKKAGHEELYKSGLKLRGIHRLPPGVAKRHSYRYSRFRSPNCEHPRPETILEAHGGITYSNRCTEIICHEALPGERRVWWFGFDCGHFMDLLPGMTKFKIRLPAELRTDVLEESYKSVDYVREEVTKLAQQLKALG